MIPFVICSFNSGELFENKLFKNFVFQFLSGLATENDPDTFVSGSFVVDPTGIEPATS